MLGGLVVWTGTRSGSPPTRPATRFAITLPVSDRLYVGPAGNSLALSADGQTVVHVATCDRVRQLYRRDWGQLDTAPLAGTEGGRYPFFSPDAAWIGFEVNGDLKRRALAGGPPATLWDGERPVSTAS